MSAASDKYEQDVADVVDKLVRRAFGRKASATRPPLPTSYSDVRIIVPGIGKVWCEVKMNHTDNLSNTRVYYKDGEWKFSEKAKSKKAAAETCRILNESKQTKEWVKDLADFCAIDHKSIWIPTTSGPIKNAGKSGYEDVVSHKMMIDYFDDLKLKKTGATQYIVQEPGYDIGDLVTIHYLEGKSEPAYYMQSGDDFYKIGTKNPLKCKGVPQFGGMGDLKVRVGLRTSYYEIQPEIKIDPSSLKESRFSVAPGTRKKNPFA